MSIDYTAITVIGSKVYRDDMFIEGMVRDCHHNLPSNDCKFCPSCGKLAYVKSKVARIPELDYTYGKIGDFDLVDCTDYSDYYFGIVQKSELRDSENMMEFPNIDELRDGLKEFLSKYDLWDEELFGIHTILYVS